MIKKSILIVFLCCMLPILHVHAQMTDEQIVDYVKTAYKGGASREEIASDLLQKGVTPDQLQRMQRMQSASATVRQPQGQDVNRLRTSNGQQERASSDEAKYVDGKKIFGHDIFYSDKLTFQSNINIPAPQSYLLGPGDEVILDIYGSSQVTNTIKVAPDGSVAIPDEKPVYVAGLTLEQAQSKIRSAIGSSYIESTIKVSLGQTRTILVNVMGEVATPGTYSLSAFSTVFHALYLAGGVNDIGTLRDIKVSRKGRIVTTVDVYEFILNGRLPGNIMLLDDDVIIVGTYESLVKIEGNVKRPMYYEMKKSESMQTLLQYAGGFTGDAYKEKIRVERRSNEGLTVHNVGEWDFGTFHNEDEDVVVVSPIIERYKNMVKISGAVFRPGIYKLDEKCNTVLAAIEQAGGLLEQAVTSRAVLLRLKEDRTFTTQSVLLQDILEGRKQDIILRNEDELFISSYTQLANTRKMSIYGEVMTPGIYNYSENTTIGDLITMAGGLNDVASLQQVEVSRRITSEADNVDGNQLAKVFTFNLDDDLNPIGEDQFKLEPYDKVVIHRSPNHKPLMGIYVGGEVQYEGWYTLSSKDDRLAALIEKAGGLTPKANADGATLVRKYSESETRERSHLIELAQSRADSIAAYAEVGKTSYRVGIDLEDAMAKPTGGSNIILEAGDSIFIPRVHELVKISGEVLSPNTVTYVKGKKASYYLTQAGGVAESGRKSKAYIVYANGQICTLKKGKILPGCEIVVPHKVPKKVDTAKVGMWATLASTAATIGAIIATILK